MKPVQEKLPDELVKAYKAQVRTHRALNKAWVKANEAYTDACEARYKACININ